MMDSCEIWKDITNYEGYYQVSNFGRVKSLSRFVNSSRGGIRHVRERILKLQLDAQGYRSISLRKEGKGLTKKVHRLVMDAFHGASNLEVDHINGVKTDNRLENLRYCTGRQNKHFYREKNKYTSEYIGVSWCSINLKWKVSIGICSKSFHLGFYNNEEEASIAFTEALLNWENNQVLPNYINENKTSKYKGVSWNSQKKKWVVQLPTHYVKRYLGSFETEDEAINILNNYLKTEV